MKLNWILVEILIEILNEITIRKSNQNSNQNPSNWNCNQQKPKDSIITRSMITLNDRINYKRLKIFILKLGKRKT